VLILPLFLAYEIGVVFASSVNGVDFVTRTVLAAVEYDRRDYLLIQLFLVAIYLGLVLYVRRQGVRLREVLTPLVLESCIYALTLGSLVVFIMQELFSVAMVGRVVDATASAKLALGEAGEALIVALGAGVHEELVFRLGLMAGGIALLRRTGMALGWAMLIALMSSAALFSLAHHLGPHGEVFVIDVFVYRVLAGVIFGLIFYYRSLAHAVYTHFLYDVYVLVIRP
jgi:hypothetical protein